MANSLEYSKKYAASFAQGLDILFYVNLQDVFGLIEEPFPDVAALHSHPWRSVSFNMGNRACVLYASQQAPGFLRDVVGQITHRRQDSG